MMSIYLAVENSSQDNNVDNRAASALRACSGEVQREAPGSALRHRNQAVWTPTYACVSTFVMSMNMKLRDCKG